MRVRRTVVPLLLALLAASALSAAKRPAAEQAKIDRLLALIEVSDAAFIRNGREYGGRKAASHLKRKLFFAGDRVRTAEDFVRGIATRSQESGELYRVRFRNGQTRPLGDWLSEALATKTPSERELRPPEQPAPRGPARVPNR